MRGYTRDWFEARKDRTRSSARAVLPLVLAVIEPASVIDLGCGTGSWLYIAQELGVTDVLGVDAPHVDGASLEIPRERFATHDLTMALNLDREFDLALCLEVAEHIAPSAAATLVQSLTRLAPAVLFSAAIPGQGGTVHVNERWPDYWARLFLDRGYRSHDFLRSDLWCDDRVRYFYAQNTILYVRESDAARYPKLPPSDFELPLPLVHPKLFDRTRSAFPPVERVTLKSLGHFAGRLIKHPFLRSTRKLA
jgi:SAM-dependent methyltransferase